MSIHQIVLVLSLLTGIISIITIVVNVVLNPDAFIWFAESIGTVIMEFFRWLADLRDE